jgi:enamine deaminase RidA (YjgF/YER057c/UK114 family)
VLPLCKTRAMERRLVSGHSPYEQSVGFSRAVVVGDRVCVAGTAPIPVQGDPPEGAYEQMRLCLAIIGGALDETGSSFADVVRTRIYLTDVADYDEIARAHGEVFSAIRPASTAIIVKGLLDPRWRVELEAEAVLG